MGKLYKISRVILAIITFVIFSIMVVNEDESWRIIPFIFATIVFILSFPSSIISKKIIIIADKIENKLLRVLYYLVSLPVIALLILGIVYLIMYSFENNMSTPNELQAALGQAFMFLFWLALEFICIVLPYIQTLIVLILKHFIKIKNGSE